MLYLPGYAQFLPPDASKTDRTIGDWELATLLSTVATVDEAKQVLLKEKAYVAQQIFPSFQQLLPLTFIFPTIRGRWSSQSTLTASLVCTTMAWAC